MAMMAAKGRLPDSAPDERLEGANNRQMMMSTNVDASTVTKLRASGRAVRLCSSDVCDVAGAAWFIVVT